MLRTLSKQFVVNPLKELAHRPAEQIGSLDALRTLAVLLVVSNHVSTMIKETTGETNWLTRLPVADGGWMGVDLFFVLSGYFIGRQLWREMQKTKGIDFSRFVIRRGLRIWPLYFATFLFAAFVLQRAEFPFGKWWSDLLFLTNYINKGIVVGSWSLCTEEQFYIIAPLLLLWGCHRNASPQAFRAALMAILIMLPMVRLLEWYFYTGSIGGHDPVAFQHLYQPIHTHSDGLVIGLLISNLEIFSPEIFRHRMFRSPLLIVAGLVAGVMAHVIQREVLMFSGLALAFGSAVAWSLSRRNASRSLANSSAFYVGSRLSYGMYLNHPYLLSWLFPLIKTWLNRSGSVIALQVESFFIVSVASVGCAAMTFCLIEHPFLEYRSKILRRSSVVGLASPVRVES